MEASHLITHLIHVSITNRGSQLPHYIPKYPHPAPWHKSPHFASPAPSGSSSGTLDRPSPPQSTFPLRCSRVISPIAWFPNLLPQPRVLHRRKPRVKPPYPSSNPKPNTNRLPALRPEPCNQRHNSAEIPICLARARREADASFAAAAIHLATGRLAKAAPSAVRKHKDVGISMRHLQGRTQKPVPAAGDLAQTALHTLMRHQEAMGQQHLQQLPTTQVRWMQLARGVSDAGYVAGAGCVAGTGCAVGAGRGARGKRRVRGVWRAPGAAPRRPYTLNLKCITSPSCTT